MNLSGLRDNSPTKAVGACKMQRWPLIVLWVMCVLMVPFAGVKAWAKPMSPPPVSAKAAELVDGMSGRVLYAKDANRRLPIASVTKLMTLYLAVRAIQHKSLSLHESVPISEEAYHVNGSQIWLEPGERLSVDHLLRAVAIGSANDAAYALGEYIAGSENAFVEDMNQTAESLGMKDTHFANPHGLSDPNHYSSAHDLALLAEKAIRMPLLLHYTGMWEDRSIRNGKGGTLWLINHNRLLRQFPGMDGLKTGYTNEAGYCIIATAQRFDTRMVAVVLGAPSSRSRFQDAASLLTYGFQNYHTIRLARRGQIAARVSVRRGAKRQVLAVYNQDRYLTVERNETTPAFIIRVESSVNAPVKPGQELGHMALTRENGQIIRIPIVAQSGVNRATWIKAAWHYLWKIAG